MAALASALLVPVGFQGKDDLHYLLAAEQWIHYGPVVGQDHWSNRLPYVLALAGSHRIAGSWTGAFYLLHVLCFIATAVITWLIAKRSLESRSAAWFGLAVLIATPILFRLPSTFYPEPLEMALAAVTTLIVLERHSWDSGRRIVWLLLGGFIGGIVLSIRQTALALPLAYAALIMLERSDSFGTRIRDVIVLAAGYFAPVLLELAYYWAMTGNPLHRFTVDAGHIQHTSPGRIAGGPPPESAGVLFNWDLVSRYQVPSLVKSHWSVAHLVRLFTSPGMLLVPWFAVAGGLIAWRLGTKARRLAGLIFLITIIQYLVITFVLALPPNTRYFGIALPLMCILAGLVLARIKRAAIAWSVYAIAFLLPGAVVAVVQPRPSASVDVVDATATRLGTRLYLVGSLADVATLRAQDDRHFASRVSFGSIPVGATAAAFAYNRPEGFDARCSDGGGAFESEGKQVPGIWYWKVVESAGIAPLIPRSIASKLRGDDNAIYLYRRRC